jgi:hypothetical protein
MDNELLNKIRRIKKILNIINKKNIDVDTIKDIMDTHDDINDKLKKYMIKTPNAILKIISDIENKNDLNKNSELTILVNEFLFKNKVDLQKEYVKKQFQIAEKEFMEKNNKEYIYQNQKETAQNIINELFINNKKAVSLIALPQVGKTGTFLYTAYLASTIDDNVKIIPPDNIFIITGMSDREWQKQTENDMIDSFRKNVFHHGKLSKFGKKIKEKEGQNILIIIDECHIATRKGQEMDEIFKGILKITDKKDINEIKNLKFLNVSATPGSVLRSLEKWGKENHSVVYLQPSNKYVGFRSFLDQERIYDSDDLNIEYLENKILKIINLRYKTNPKFHIFRINNMDKIKILEDFCKNHNFKCYHHNSNTRRNFDEEIKNIPKKHTFVIIKGFYRAGKRLTDKNIGIAYEHNNDINFDITPQGLIGRFCGNDKINTKDNSPYFICNKDTIKGYLDFIQNGCNGDYISKNYKIVNNKVIRETETYVDNIKNKEYNDTEKYSMSDYVDIPYIINLDDEEDWENFINDINKKTSEEKLELIKIKIKKYNNDLYKNIIKNYKNYKIMIPGMESKKSYDDHILVPINCYKNKKPFKKDIDKKYEYKNVWGCFIDKKNPRLIILVYHGEKYKKLIEQTIESSDEDSDDEPEYETIEHKDKEYYLDGKKIYRINKDKSIGEYYGKYIDGEVIKKTDKKIKIKTKTTDKESKK